MSLASRVEGTIYLVHSLADGHMLWEGAEEKCLGLPSVDEENSFVVIIRCSLLVCRVMDLSNWKIGPRKTTFYLLPFCLPEAFSILQHDLGGWRVGNILDFYIWNSMGKCLSVV